MLGEEASPSRTSLPHIAPTFFSSFLYSFSFFDTTSFTSAMEASALFRTSSFASELISLILWQSTRRKERNCDDLSSLLSHSMTCTLNTLSRQRENGENGRLLLLLPVILHTACSDKKKRFGQRVEVGEERRRMNPNASRETNMYGNSWGGRRGIGTIAPIGR